MSAERGWFAEKWEQYRLKVVPANAGPVQMAETRQAFYSGAYAAFCALLEVQLSDGQQVTDGDVRKIEALHQEVEAECAAMAARGSGAPA
jgi:hypothetical protein